MAIFLAILAGFGLGYIIERGDMCFHSTIRGFMRQPRQLELFRAYLFAILIATPLVWGMTALGLIAPWIPPFAWQANLVGGLIFGIGMVVAATCITGLFYKLGHGMLGTLVALVTWAIGDFITYRGPLSPLRETLNSTPVTVNDESATLLNLFGPAGVVVVIGLGAIAAIWLWRSPRQARGKLWDWVILGSAVGLFTSFAWLLADAGGSDYTYGTSGVPTSLILSFTEGGALWSTWITVALASLIPGALLAATLSGTLWVRGESLPRYLELAAGGLLMGVGAAISGGCNLGHSLVGVPLLSLGSITTTLSMVVGVGLAHYVGQALRTTRSRSVADVSYSRAKG